MQNEIKSLFSGIIVLPFILIFTLGVSLASGVNLHFVLVSVILTNMVGILLDRDSSVYYNLGPGIIVTLFVYAETLGLQSGYLQTLITFSVPAIAFIVLSFLPLKFSLIPSRAIAIISFGLGLIIVIKQIPNAFAYNSIQSDFSYTGESTSFLSGSTLSNWIQLFLAISIPVLALIGQYFKQANKGLIFSTLLAIIIGYAAGFTDEVVIGRFTFNEPFIFHGEFANEMFLQSISAGFTISVLMLMNFWGHFSILQHNQQNEAYAIKKSLRVVGFGNLLGGIFGVFPSNVSLVDSYSIRSFGGTNWLAKIPIILVLLIVTLYGIPDFSFPLFAFAGVLMYIGILMILKSRNILKDLKVIDYIFTFIIGMVLVLVDFTTGFILAMLYTFIHSLIYKDEGKNDGDKILDEKALSE